MPASFGYHPGFRWPLPFGQPRARHFIEFEREEPAAVRRIDAAGLLTPEAHRTPVAGRRLELTDALFAQDVLIFERLNSTSLSYGGQEGPRLRIGFPDASYLGLWTKPGADFVCIEPWHGITDPRGFCGDFRDKPGVKILKPGEAFFAENGHNAARPMRSGGRRRPVRDPRAPFTPSNRRFGAIFGGAAPRVSTCFHGLQPPGETHEDHPRLYRIVPFGDLGSGSICADRGERFRGRESRGFHLGRGCCGTCVGDGRTINSKFLARHGN